MTFRHISYDKTVLIQSNTAKNGQKDVRDIPGLWLNQYYHLYVHKQYTHLKVQMNYVVLMETSHTHQNLPGQSNDVFLCKGLIIISNTLVKDFTSGSTERQKEQENNIIDLKLHGFKLCFTEPQKKSD